MLMAASSGLYLYQVKNRTRLLDRQIAQIIKTSDATRARTGVLQAEWALQNDPERLQDLANRFLALRPVAPSQFVIMADLDHRLPAVDIPTSAPMDAPEAQIEPPAPIDSRSVPAEPTKPIADAIPKPLADPTIRNTVETPPKAPPSTPVFVASKPSSSVTISLAPLAPQPLPHQAVPLPHAIVAAATPVPSVTLHPPRSRYETAQGNSTASEVIDRIVRSGHVDASVPVVASVLGAARTILAPPVPVPVASTEAAAYTAQQ